MSYQLLLVDDEPLARERLKRMLNEHQDFTVVGEAADGVSALDWLQQHSADAVLLDIQMPGMDGMAVAERMQQLPKPPLVVFCTAFDDYALDAFGVNAVDYLLKPVRREDLSRALGRLALRLPSAAMNVPVLADNGHPGSARTHLSARTHQGLVLIAVEDVLYFVADQKYVNVVHTGGETLIDDSLRQLEDEFGSQFVRVHRSALVSRDRIERLVSQDGGGHKVYLRGLNGGISVSRRHMAEVRKVMRSL
jgi:two-component system, LytTR family, response regulator AlgR